MKPSRHDPDGLNRRQFLKTSTALAGTVLLSPWALAEGGAAAGPTVTRTATDQVTLGKTGIKLSRLGFGTGSDNGYIQTADGRSAFTSLIHYAYDRGITYLDTAQAYQTFDWIADAIKGLPREKLFIQSKVDGRPQDVLAVIDHHRKTFDTDYVDSLLVHCMTRGDWTDAWKRVMDGFNEAQERKWIRAKGVSCHSLPALRAAVTSDWSEVHLVRVNPQGAYTDGEDGSWGRRQHDIGPVMQQIKIMHAKGRGVIGMKICGNGTFTSPADREKSIRFAMSQPEIDAVVIGFKNRQEIDEAIERINRALKAV
ncbi:MAG TPA: aldo/keto reductase [Candidatus Sulfopaludibacter sp.]|nr:aldo/keto reductase [Candidatus Sulfopaludibacter sp.]